MTTITADAAQLPIIDSAAFRALAAEQDELVRQSRTDKDDLTAIADTHGRVWLRVSLEEAGAPAGVLPTRSNAPKSEWLAAYIRYMHPRTSEAAKRLAELKMAAGREQTVVMRLREMIAAAAAKAEKMAAEAAKGASHAAYFIAHNGDAMMLDAAKAEHAAMILDAIDRAKFDIRDVAAQSARHLLPQAAGSARSLGSLRVGAYGGQQAVAGEAAREVLKAIRQAAPRGTPRSCSPASDPRHRTARPPPRGSGRPRVRRARDPRPARPHHGRHDSCPPAVL